MKRYVRHFALPVGAVMTVAALAACNAPAEPEDPTSVRISVPISAYLPATWDPTSGFVTTYLMPTQTVYESLIVVDPADYSYQPLLAEDFSVDESRKAMSIRLRDDVDFTDGVHLDAQAAVDALTAVLDSEATYFHSAITGQYSPEVTVTGEYELRITTSKGIGRPFLDALAILPIASPAALADPDTIAVTPAGTGPYLIDEFVPEVSLSVVRNPDYRDPARFEFDTVEFAVFTDPIAAFNAVKSGQLDVAQINPQLAAEAKSSGLDVFSGAGSVKALCWFDHATGGVQPALNDVRVRQAISMAFDREAVADAIGLGYYTPTTQVFIEGQAEYVEGGDDRYSYDLDAAKALLAEAGYADGFDITIPTFLEVADVTPFIQQSLADLGIRVTLESFPTQVEFSPVVVTGKYALAPFMISEIYAVSYLDDNGFLNPSGDGSVTLGSGAGPVDPKIAGILDRLNNGSTTESAEASKELGEFLLEEQWYIPIYREKDVWATAAGYGIDPGKVGRAAALDNVTSE